MPNFIYVFSEESRDKLLCLQYEMLTRDDAKHVYVFLNNGRMDFAEDSCAFVLSDMLTF